MDTKERFKITSNEQYLCTNIKVNLIVPHLYQDGVISEDDTQRIDFEATESNKVHKLLRIIEEHPKGFKSFCQALKKETMEYIADALEKTPIDEKEIEREQQWSDKRIDTIVKQKFVFEPNGQVFLGNVIEDIRLAFLQDGYSYHVHDDHIVRRVMTNFPKVSCNKTENDKIWVFRNLVRKCNIDELPKIIDKPKALETAKGEVQNIGKPLEDLSPNELVRRICPRFPHYKIPPETEHFLLDGEITGKHFKRLEFKYMHDLFPHLTKGDIFSMINLRDDIIREEEAKIQSQTYSEAHIPLIFSHDTDIERFRESFRKFDHENGASNCYRKEAILTTSKNRPGNLLDPVHFFSTISKCDDSTYSKIFDEIIQFASACLNERSNGTIHFGITPRQNDLCLEGLIIGLPLDRQECLKRFNKNLADRFYSEQICVALRCVRPPQFIEVSSNPREPETSYVLEVDIVPDSSLVNEDAFFVKTVQGDSPVLYLFCENGISPTSFNDEKTRQYMSKTKNLISDYRKKLERRHPVHVIKSDLRQKMLDCFCHGEEHISSDIYPLLFLSPLENAENSKINMDNFEFLVDIDPSAIFDFDYSKQTNGLYRYVENEKCQIVTALTTDNFDPQSIENQRLKVTPSNLFEDIRQPNLKPWIFCNGYEPMNKSPMSRKEWKQNRRIGFKEAIRFYRNDIPPGRGLILFFLFSKDYEIMLEAAEEVILNFKDQWILIAETEEIANHWCSELLRRETIDKRDIEKRTILGMPWNHVNQTIQQLAGAYKSIRCEIPTSNGAFCHLKEKDKNKLYDIEIISRNECDDPEIIHDGVKLAFIRRNVAETFYRGGSPTWWNFWFPDHILKRDIHGKLKLKIKEALSGNKAEEDNKIGLVYIYHQPGAGGTTTAMHVMWELRTKYRCCIVKQITDQTADQIADLRTHEDTEDPKPPLVMIDNGDEDKISVLFAVLQNKAKVEARRGSRDIRVFCVLLLCIRKTLIASGNDMSVALKHDLSPQELEWFRSRHETLEKQFNDNKGSDPKFLISFNILKKNFDKEYIHSKAHDLVEGVLEVEERRILKYLSLLNTFELECPKIKISAFDPIMPNKERSSSFIFGLATDCGRRKKTDWENHISQPLQVLLNQSFRPGLGRQLIRLSIINPLFAKAIFSCFIVNEETTSSIVIEFLNSEIFKSSNMSTNEVMDVVKNIMKKREEKEISIKEKFSPLIMKIVEEEGDKYAKDVLVKVFEMTKDPMICQHIARLYIHFQNWNRAEEYAKLATQLNPQNSSLWDTYGQVYKRRLLSKYIVISRQDRNLSGDEIEEAIDIAKLGVANFRKEQEVSETEYFSKENNAGYYGELRLKKFIQGDKVWETEDFITKLLRIEGTLIKGTEVSCNIETVSSGISQFVVPTSDAILNRSLWQKRIFFVLGFSWAGIKAFDVRKEMPVVSTPAVPRELGNSAHQFQATNKTVGLTHDEFMERFLRLSSHMDELQADMNNKETIDKDRKALKDRHKALESELNRLIRDREEFFSI